MSLPLVSVAFTILRWIYNAALNGLQRTLGLIFSLVSVIFTFITSSLFKNTAPSTPQSSNAPELLLVSNTTDVTYTNGPIPEAGTSENVSHRLSTGTRGGEAGSTSVSTLRSGQSIGYDSLLYDF